MVGVSSFECAFFCAHVHSFVHTNAAVRSAKRCLAIFIIAILVGVVSASITGVVKRLVDVKLDMVRACAKTKTEKLR